MAEFKPENITQWVIKNCPDIHTPLETASKVIETTPMVENWSCGNVACPVIIASKSKHFGRYGLNITNAEKCLNLPPFEEQS